MGVLLASLLASLLALGAWNAPDPLIEAAREGDLALVRSLLSGGADPRAASGDGMTALHWAAQSGSLEIAQALLDAGADVDATTRIGSHTALHVAARGGHVNVARALVSAGGDPNARAEPSGVTPLHLAAASLSGAELVAALVEAGANPDATEATSGQTPLIFGAARGRTAAVLELLRLGADPGISTKRIDVLSQLALDREASRRLRNALEELRSSPAPPDDASSPELSTEDVQRVIHEQRAFLRSGYDVGNVTAHSLARVRPDYPGGPDVVRPPFREVLVGYVGGMTALLHAAREGHVGSVRALLDGGADIDQVSADGTSPLLIALMNGQFDTALELLGRGANPDLSATTDGLSPLFAVLQTQFAPKSNYPQPRAHDVQDANYMEVLEALLDAGADPNVRLNTHLWFWEYGLNKMGIDLTGATPFWRAAFAQEHPGHEAPRGTRCGPRHPHAVAGGGHAGAETTGRAPAGGLGVAAHSRGCAQRVPDPCRGGRRVPGTRRVQRAERSGPVHTRGAVPG